MSAKQKKVTKFGRGVLAGWLVDVDADGIALSFRVSFASFGATAWLVSPKGRVPGLTETIYREAQGLAISTAALAAACARARK